MGKATFIGVVVAPLVFGCGAGGASHSLVVGNDGTGGAHSESSGSGGVPMLTEDASVSNVLSAHIEDSKRVTVTFITLSCSDSCAEVVAVPEGGFAPYSFEWEDESTNQNRHVCPTATRNYEVTVRDTGSTSGEFTVSPQIAKAQLTADVVQCLDGGGGAVDAGSSSGGLCVSNPSFEGPVTPTQFQAFDAPPWNACYAGGFITYSAIADPTLWPNQNWTFPKASDGATYLALGEQSVLGGRASQTLCSPIAAGASRSFLVDLARATTGNSASDTTPEMMQVLGGTSECNETEVLWTSPPLTVAWATYCVTVRPQQNTTTLGFRPQTTAVEMEGLVDHLVPVASCP